MLTSYEGEVVLQYRLSVLLGRGGMGCVYRAEHQLVPEQRAAVKILDRTRFGVDDGYEKFLNEARALSRVRHPGLCQVYNMGLASDGSLCIVMELVEGRTLRQRLSSQGPLAPAAAAAIIAEVAAVLQVMHAARIVHRDLKPDNIMLCDEGAAPGIKLLDFGIARILTDTTSESAATGVAGTAAYMAPEQQRGVLSPAVDLYALGVVFLELLTGTNDTAAPRPRLARRLRAVLDGLLAPDPARRPSAAEVVSALGPGPGPGKDPALRPAPPRWAVGATTALGFSLWAAQTPPAKETMPPPPGMVFVQGGQSAIGRTDAEVEEARAVCEAELAECQRAPYCSLTPDWCNADFYARSRGQRVGEVPDFFIDEVEVSNERLASWLDRLPGVRVREERFVFDELGVQLLDLAGESGVVYQDGRFLPRKGQEQLPVVQLTWDGANHYCAVQGKTLPSEVEYERLLRSIAFPARAFGPGDCDRVALGRASGLRCAPRSRPSAVGTSPGDRTPEGVMDLLGNVLEWTRDPFRLISGVAAPTNTAADYRVARGGYYDGPINSASPENRVRWDRTRGAPNLGFRCMIPTR